MNNINDIEIKTIVNRIGKEAFITIFYPEIKSNPEISSKEIALKYHERSYSSWNLRTSYSKKLFENGLEKDALRYIIESSKKLNAKIVRKAEAYLNEV